MNKYVAVGVAIVCLLAASVVLLAFWAGDQGSSAREIPGIGTPDYIYTGDDDTLYLFSGRNITALSPDGTLRYQFDLPANYSVGERWYFYSWWDYVYVQESNQPIVSSANGTLYVYLVPTRAEIYKDDGSWDSTGYSLTEYYGRGLFLAIGPDGRQEWSLPLESLMVPVREYQYLDDSPVSVGPYNYTIRALSDAYIGVSNGTLYVFHGYNESAIGDNGTLLWTISGVTDPAMVDEAGNVYVVDVSSLPGMVTDSGKPIVASWVTFGRENYRAPGMIVDSYYPNGSLRWRALTVDLVQRQPGSGPLLQYNNHTIYVPLGDAVMAIADNGTELWKKRFDRSDYPFLPEDAWNYAEQYSKYIDAPKGGDFRFDESMLFDRDGNLYLKHYSDERYSGSYYTIVLAPDGTVASSRKVSRGNDSGYTARDEVLYRLETAPVDGTASGKATLAGSGETYTLVAYNGKTEAILWKYTLPRSDPEEGELTEAKIRQFFNEETADRLINYTRTRDMSFLVGEVTVYGADNSSWCRYYRTWNLTSPVLSTGWTDVRPGKDRVYLDVRSLNYENPANYTSPRYTYSGKVYALDTNGTLLWSIPVALNDRVLATGNSTVFYESGDGKVYVKYAGAAAAGVTFLSALFLFFKYFLAGTVSRARDRVDRNENRTAVLQYIKGHPGLTQYEIARGTGQNLGTVRYHLLILGINHKILEHRAGGKYVRYFTNGGSYTEEERTVISLLKRDTTGKVMCLLHAKPGASNGEISRELDIPESIASRCTRELADLGLITREPSGRGFRLKEEYGHLVDRITDRPPKT